ncbi:hypothetical protein KKF34_04505 [Myxococcota bacterium]|nr:hypothetical protein [Myxococcota bacterium]
MIRGFRIIFGFAGDVIHVYVITPAPSRLSRAGLINFRLCGHRLMIRRFNIEVGFEDLIEGGVIAIRRFEESIEVGVIIFRLFVFLIGAFVRSIVVPS